MCDTDATLWRSTRESRHVQRDQSIPRRHNHDSSRLWINHVLDRTMRSRVRSTRKKQEVFKWTKCMEDFVLGQLEEM